jgi:hypothetical protein
MGTQAQRQLAAEVRERPAWSAAVRVGFGWCFLYFTLYTLTTQVFSGLWPTFQISIPDAGAAPPVRAVVFWVSAKVFGADTSKMVYSGSGSGDKTYDWVLAFCALLSAVAGTVVWSVLDRRRGYYARLHKWFYLGLRFAVGSQLLLYGMIKMVPLQMPFPSLSRLVEPYGNFSPMGVLWYSIGASPGYEMFVGSAEAFGGILLFFPRTALFGAMVCLADAIEVFMLNMTYDVPVKLFSFHLIVMCLMLLAPEMGRIGRFFFSDGELKARNRVRWGRVALAVQVVWGVALIANNAYGARTSWYRYGGGTPKSALYGIWNIEGHPQWRRVIFDRPTGMTLQKLDDSFVICGAAIDTTAGMIAVTRGNDKSWGSLKYERTEGDALRLDGVMGGEKTHLRTKLLDRNKMLLVSRGFHWVQEYPFNR